LNLVLVVVDHEHPARAGTNRLIALFGWFGLEVRVGCGERQADGELAALARSRASGLDGAAVQFHEAASKRQSDSQPTARAFKAAVALREQVEDPGKKVVRNSIAIVAHRDGDLVPRCVVFGG